MYNLVACSTNHPDPLNPYIGLFNERSLKNISKYTKNLDVISPRPIVPPIGPYKNYYYIPKHHHNGYYPIHHPRFGYLPPRSIFRYNLSGSWFRKMVDKYIDEELSEPDIIHAGHIYFDGYGMLPYCKKHEVPLTVMGRGKILNNFNSLRYFSRKRVKSVLSFADKIFCVSQSLADQAANLVSSSKVYVLPNGANPEYYPTDRKKEIKEELGIPSDMNVILYCGGFTQRKGMKEMLKMINNTSFEDTYIILVGHYGNYGNKLRKALLNSAYKNRSKVLWKVSPVALRRWFASADLLLLPSYAEGRPNVIYEAMASETAVIATKVSGIPEQVKHEETGLLIPAKDEEALINAVSILLNDPRRMKLMGENGKHKLVEEGWTWSHHGEQLKNHHLELIT